MEDTKSTIPLICVGIKTVAWKPLLKAPGHLDKSHSEASHAEGGRWLQLSWAHSLWRGHWCSHLALTFDSVLICPSHSTDFLSLTSSLKAGSVPHCYCGHFRSPQAMWIRNSPKMPVVCKPCTQLHRMTDMLSTQWGKMEVHPLLAQLSWVPEAQNSSQTC